MVIDHFPDGKESKNVAVNALMVKLTFHIENAWLCFNKNKLF